MFENFGSSHANAKAIERTKTIKYCMLPKRNGLFKSFIKISIQIICKAKNKAAINSSESDCWISIDWLDDNKYDPYKQSKIAIKYHSWSTRFFLNTKVYKVFYEVRPWIDMCKKNDITKN